MLKISGFFIFAFIVSLYSCTSHETKYQTIAYDTIPKVKSVIDSTLINQESSALNISETNYDLLISKFVNKKKNIDTYYKWIENIIAKNIDGDTTYMTKNCLDYTNDAIDFFWGYVSSIDEKTFRKKWKNQYDLKHSNFSHLFETGDCGWATKKISGFKFLGELNNADWFMLTIKGGCVNNDFSKTIIRVIKIIKKENSFYIDNIMSLSKE
jgi:hypothetical protein